MSCDCVFEKDLESSVDHMSLPLLQLHAIMCHMSCCPLSLENSTGFLHLLTVPAWPCGHLICKPWVIVSDTPRSLPAGWYGSSLITSQLCPAVYYPLVGKPNLFPVLFELCLWFWAGLHCCYHRPSRLKCCSFVGICLGYLATFRVFCLWGSEVCVIEV